MVFKKKKLKKIYKEVSRIRGNKLHSCLLPLELWPMTAGWGFTFQDAIIEGHEWKSPIAFSSQLNQNEGR